MKRVLLSALLGTAALLPATAMAQSAQCDRLVQFMEQNQGTKLSIDMNRAKALQRDKNEAECTTVLAQAQPQNGQQPAQAGAQQPAQPGDSEDANATPEAKEGQGDNAGKAANIVVQQPAPTISVDQAAPQVTVNQPQPNVTVRQPQPEIIVRQPAPVVTIDIPQPEIIVRMPKPEVTVQQAQPTVQVQQPQPQVRVEQPEQPQVQVQKAAPANVQLAQPQGQANVQVEQAGDPKVTYERAEPKVTINQAKGQPTIRMEGQQPAGDQAGQQPAADQAGQPPAGQQGAQLNDSEDANKTPEAMEGQNGQPQGAAQGDQQQADATQAGQQPAAGGQGQMQRVAVADIDGATVINERGEQLGKVDGIVQSAADQKRYVVINHGGFLGLGEKKIALSLEGLAMQGDRVVVPGLSDDEVRALPEFKESDQYPEVKDTEVEFRTMAQQ